MNEETVVDVATAEEVVVEPAVEETPVTPEGDVIPAPAEDAPTVEAADEVVEVTSEDVPPAPLSVGL